MKNFYRDKDILITGGAGSVGSTIVKELTKYDPKRIRILDLSENSLFHLQHSLKNHKNIRYFVGSINDKEKIKLATKGVDLIFHCAALKHVPSCEYNSFEAVNTNIIGLMNLITATKEQNVGKFIYISTDKAVNPHNIMGTTKLLGEKLIANAWMGETTTKFATVRFGNVLNSNGSVIPLWKKQIKNGSSITITDPTMTRFFMTLKEAANLVLKVAKETEGRETHILKMRSLNINDLAESLLELTNSKIRPTIIGKRPGEKPYELLMTQEEATTAENNEKTFKIANDVDIWTPHRMESSGNSLVPVNTSLYDSRKSNFLSKEEIKTLLITEGIVKNE
jgi:UDP-N-acetylglucosamine 4,6-dehydratase/5-epimerase